ncbi:alpha/beta hydrolase [Microbulbifer sp. THAF38]|uniref:alpha/beta hydrolase n=1 Tax=Microbulbifer sp. THAF38 TaxID=2587856 RepID=UPI001267C85C|nr:alpha/beta hydrolase-fold protein [Microbulbifer sp. THAF38]QFT56445.1 Ferri-bacillibactin esterase BesA [Microbulbifer sp. THAF38]
MRLLLSTIFFVLVVSVGSVSAGTAEPVSFTRGEILSFYYQSDLLARQYQIDVLLPKEYDPKNDTVQYPVVYMLDGYLDFPMMAPNFFKQSATGKIPAFIFVGIDYVDDSLGKLRRLDLTPTAVEMDGEIQGGGANQFLEFINEELKPFINNTFPADQQDQTFMGHSLGGLFALHTLFTQPDSFHRYIIASPSVWWDDKVILAKERHYAEYNADMNKHIFMFVGKEEGFMVKDMKQLVRRLESRNYPSLKLSKKVFKGENHLTVPVVGYNFGIRKIFKED